MAVLSPNGFTRYTYLSLFKAFKLCSWAQLICLACILLEILAIVLDIHLVDFKLVAEGLIILLRVVEVGDSIIHPPWSQSISIFLK